MLEIILRPKAETDIRDIATYTIEEWGEAQAKQYIINIRKQIERAAAFPEIGPDVDELGLAYRKLSSGSHRIYYRIENDQLIVVRILHERMDFEALL